MFSDLTAPFTCETNGSISLISQACTPASVRNVSAASIVNAGAGAASPDCACADPYNAKAEIRAEKPEANRSRRVVVMTRVPSPASAYLAQFSCRGGLESSQLDHGPI